jgi:hypothetical protein
MTYSDGDVWREKIQRPWRVGLTGLIAIISLTAIMVLLAASARVSADENDLLASPNIRSTTAVASNYPDCRFGVGGGTNDYPVTALNVGWSMDWGTQLNPPQLNGAEYIQVVRLQPALGGYSFTPATTTLYSIIDQNPGSIWLIGNEPDSPYQDALYPATYAQAYHQVYYLIKQRDPSARIGIGSIVQPTPIRFQYLDLFLAAYQQSYGENPPADIWSTHSYILREIDHSDPQAQPHGPYEVWGAYIPKGITVTRGILYNYSDMFSLTIFQQRLIDMRSWMRDRGYGDKPLYVTEYGTLFPYPPYITPPPSVDENGVALTESRTQAFMTASFKVMQTLTSTLVGYAVDANRLVQRWLWYSVSDPGYGGPLFDPYSHALRPLGAVFYSYTNAISPSIDLLAVQAVADPAALNDTEHPQTTTLNGTISNIGNISITQPIIVAFYSGTPPTGTLIGPLQVITSGLMGCADRADVSVTWSVSSAGPHPFYMQVDPGNTLSELTRANNQVSGSFLIAAHQIYLPIIRKSS